MLNYFDSNLDAAGEQALVHAITEARAAGTTVVLIAHRPSIMQVADKILVLKDGVVEQFGKRADIFASVVPQAAQPAGAAVTGGGTVRRLARVREGA